MGYTHYFSHKKTTKEKWEKILDDCKTLRDWMPVEKIRIVGWNGHYTTPAEFTMRDIIFNGKGDLSHETFHISPRTRRRESWERKRDMPFAFCKTAAKPYDLLVCACLLVYKHYSPETMELNSDGESGDWAGAERLVKERLGYEVKFDNVRHKESE